MSATFRLPFSATELLRQAAEIARRDMRNESAATMLEKQADIAERIQAEKEADA